MVDVAGESPEIIVVVASDAVVVTPDVVVLKPDVVVLEPDAVVIEPDVVDVTCGVVNCAVAFEASDNKLSGTKDVEGNPNPGQSPAHERA